MTSSELFTFIKSWVDLVLNTPTQTMLVIKSHQDAPLPLTPCIVVDYAASRNRVGRAHSTALDNNADHTIINDYELRLQLTEINSDGDGLKILLNSLETKAVTTLFTAGKVAFLRAGEITVAPILPDTSHWFKESILEIWCGVSESITENTSYIETIELVNNILDPQT